MKKVMFIIMLCGVFFIAAGTISAQVSNNALFDSGKYYRLTSEFLGQGKSLDITNDNNNTAFLGDTGNYTGQFWRIEKLSNGYYRLTTQFRGKNLSLDVINDGTNNRLHLAETGNYTGQFWKIEKLNGGYYRLTTAFQGEGKSLDVVNDGQKRNVQLAATGNYSGQFWMITEVNSNSVSNNNGNNNPEVTEENNNPEVIEENNNSGVIEGYTGPTTKREIIITLPFAKPQKLTVEVASDGTVIWQGDMILGNISDFSRYNPPSTDANSRIWSNSFIPYLIKANYLKRDLTLAGIKIPDFIKNYPSSSNANSRIWSNSTIPYVLPANHGKRDIILAGINEINSKTNLCLVPRTNQTDYVEFISEDGHWATLGRVGGRQEISIDQTVSYVPMGTVAHEIMHAAGFSHIQSREDRDRYVTINFGNIQSDMRYNFDRLTDKASNIGAYDFGSVMHYHAKAFSINNRNTIDIKGGGDTSKMGQRDGVSAGDIAALATIYAPGPCKPATKPTPQPTPSPQPTQPTTTGTDNTENIAIGKKARQGATSNSNLGQESGSDANKAVDGNTDGRFDMSSVTKTGEGKFVWWEIDLGAVYDVSKIVIWNRTDECCWNWQQNLMIATSDLVQPEGVVGGVALRMPPSEGQLLQPITIQHRRLGAGNGGPNIGPIGFSSSAQPNITVPINREARYIMIYKRDGDMSRNRRDGTLKNIFPGLSLAEVQVFGTPVPANTSRRF